jgi:hypothetical protein
MKGAGMSAAKNVAMLPELGTALQRNTHVRKIYTALEPTADGSWEVVTVVETALALDARDPDYHAEACERLVQDVETDARAGMLVGRVILRGR